MQKFTRTDLQNHKNARIRQRSADFVRQHYGAILNAAELGDTSYFVDFNQKLKTMPGCNTRQPPELTMNNYVEAFREQFPDCTVEYIEIWVDIPATKYDAQTKILKKGIQIDWS